MYFLIWLPMQDIQPVCEENNFMSPDATCCSTTTNSIIINDDSSVLARYYAEQKVYPHLPLADVGTTRNNKMLMLMVRSIIIIDGSSTFAAATKLPAMQQLASVTSVPARCRVYIRRRAHTYTCNYISCVAHNKFMGHY